jgi:hypothetical protein
LSLFPTLSFSPLFHCDTSISPYVGENTTQQGQKNMTCSQNPIRLK